MTICTIAAIRESRWRGVVRESFQRKIRDGRHRQLRGERTDGGENERQFVFADIFKAGGVFAHDGDRLFRRLFGIFQKLYPAAETNDARYDLSRRFRHDGKHDNQHGHRQIGYQAYDGHCLRSRGDNVKAEYKAQYAKYDESKLLQEKTADHYRGGSARVHAVFRQQVGRERLSARTERRNVIVKLCDHGGLRRKFQAELSFEAVKQQRRLEPVERQHEQTGYGGQNQIVPVAPITDRISPNGSVSSPPAKSLNAVTAMLAAQIRKNTAKNTTFFFPDLFFGGASAAPSIASCSKFSPSDGGAVSSWPAPFRAGEFRLRECRKGLFPAVPLRASCCFYRP